MFRCDPSVRSFPTVQAVEHTVFGVHEWPGSSGIDYIFVSTGRGLTVKDIRRRVFWRELAPPDQFFPDDEGEIPNYLTDHVGLELEFSVAQA